MNDYLFNIVLHHLFTFFVYLSWLTLDPCQCVCMCQSQSIQSFFTNQYQSSFITQPAALPSAVDGIQ